MKTKQRAVSQSLSSRPLRLAPSPLSSSSGSGPSTAPIGNLGGKIDDLKKINEFLQSLTHRAVAVIMENELDQQMDQYGYATFNNKACVEAPQDTPAGDFDASYYHGTTTHGLRVVLGYKFKNAGGEDYVLAILVESLITASTNPRDVEISGAEEDMPTKSDRYNNWYYAKIMKKDDLPNPGEVTWKVFENDYQDMKHAGQAHTTSGGGVKASCSMDEGKDSDLTITVKSLT